MDSLYLSRAWISCYEGEGDDAAGTAAAATSAAAAAVDTNKLFTQDELNKILAEDKRKHQAALAKVEAKLQETLKSATLSEQDRKTLEENLQAVQGQLRTKEQQAALERKQLEEQYQARVADIEKRAIFFETLYRDSTIERALQDAAVKNDAFSSSQIITQVRPWTKMLEVMDEKTGKGTGKYKPVVDMPDVDATTGEQVVMTRTPEEAVKRMKELPEMYGNLFRSGVVSGIGSSSATGGLASGAGGKINVKNLTHEQFLKIRKENPDLLGLRPAGRR